jgi:butyrate kinase
MEKLIQEIMKDLECSREDAEEVAKMEMKAKGLKRYEQAEKPRKKVERERKVDEVKKEIIDELVACISKNIGKVTKVKTETEIDFVYADEDFTLKLTRHRKKK